MIDHNSAERAPPMSETPTLTQTRKRRPPSGAGATAQRDRLALGELVRAQFADGEWHRLETIVAATGAPEKKVRSTLDLMTRWGTYNSKCDRKKVGKEYHFRLSPRDNQISVHELIEKLTPILKELEIQGRANAATMSPPTVRIMTAKIQKLLKEWAE